MTVNLSALAGAGQQFFDDNGDPLSGGKLWSYVAGTTTPQTSYVDAAGSIPHSNPIILNAAGRVPTGEIWISAGQQYKFVLTTSADVLLVTWDNITGINGTGLATNAQYVAYDAPFIGAVQTNVEAKLSEITSITDFGASSGASPADNARAIQYGLTAPGEIFVPNVDATFQISDRLTVNEGNIVWSLNGSIYQTTPSTSTFFAITADPPTNNTLFYGLNLSQDTSAPIGGGSDNNHAQLKWLGGEYNRAAFNYLTGQYAISFGYGAASLADRRHQFGVAVGNVLDNLQGMGIENIGASYTAIIGNVGNSSGSRGPGTKAAFHGIRLTGYSQAAGDPLEAACVGVVAAGNAFKGFARGISPQNTARLWNISSQYVEEADYAVQLFESTAPSSAPQLGYINFTAQNVGRAIYGIGYGYNSFDFIADGSNSDAAPFIEELSDATALGHNRYRGILKNTASTGATFRYDYQTIDLTIDGSAGTGAQITGDYNAGTLTVNNAGSTGVLISGNNNLIRCVVTNATGVAVSVSGDNNSVEILTDGDVSVSGDNNQIKGVVGGTITKSGTGNDYSGVKGFVASGATTATTDGSGELTITPSVHPSATISGFTAIVSNFSNNWSVRVKTITSGAVTLVVFNAAGSPVTSTSVQIRWNLICT